MNTFISNRTRTAALIPFLILASIAASCRNGTSNLTPAQQTQVNLYASVDVITTANKGVAQGIVALNKQGTVGDEITRSVLGWSKKVNDSARTSLAVLDSAQTPAAKAQAVLDLLKVLDLPAPVAAFVNSNPSVAAVVDVVKLIVQIQQTVAQVRATPPALLSVAKGATP